MLGNSNACFWTPSLMGVALVGVGSLSKMGVLVGKTGPDSANAASTDPVSNAASHGDFINFTRGWLIRS